MMENSHSCPACRNNIKEHLIADHIKVCQIYKPNILNQVIKLPRNFPIDDTKFMLAELALAREELTNRLNESNIDKKRLHPKPVVKKVVSSIDVHQDKLNIDIMAYNQDLVDCKNCKRKFYSSYDLSSLVYVEECWHLFCIPCMVKYIDQQYVNNGGCLRCMVEGCAVNVSEPQVKSIVGEAKFETLQGKAIRKMMNIVECAKCKSEYEFVPGNPKDAPKKDANGKNITPSAAQHYANCRFTCSKADCKAEQCKECQAVPYHLGMSCKEFKAHAIAKKCRYCDDLLDQKNQSKTLYQAHKDICNKADCQDLVKQACTKVLPCSHSCSGFAGQANCLACLHEKCCQDNPELNGQKGDDYCAICYIQPLTASPCIRSQCGHVFHVKCIQKRLQIKWLTPRILFNFCLCPLCKKWMKFPQESPLSKPVIQNAELFIKIQTMSLERLKFQGCDKDDKLKDKASPYFEKPTQYAMAIYAYFQCFKCKKPYFGGRKNCADAMNQGQNQVAFKPEQLICPNCCEIPIQNCVKHGKDFIEFKCKFCCSTAQWFCWGNTHFCEPCHKRQCNGDYVSKYTKDQLPKCAGGSKCPIGGNHEGNGEQRSLGCAICRNYKQNNASF